MQEFDLAIVGGGILGVAHAYHALRMGMRVALIEKDARPNGATVRNFGQIVPSGMDAKWQTFGRKSLEIYQDLQLEADITARPYGSIYVASNEEEMTLLEELARINRDQDYASHLLTRAACLQQYPGLKTSYARGGLFFPQELTIDPREAVYRIIGLLENNYQLSYFPSTLVTEISSAAQAYVLINNRRLAVQARKVVICSGSDFQTLFPEVFRNSGLQRVKLQMLQTRPQVSQRIPGSVLTGWTIRRYESFQGCPSFSAIKAKEDPQAYHHLWGIHILFKQAADGSVIIGDSHEYYDVDGGETIDFGIDETINQAIVTAAKSIFELQTYDIWKTWIGEYSQCKDRDVFEMEVLPGVHIVTGIGGKGMTGALGFAAQNLSSII